MIGRNFTFDYKIIQSVLNRASIYDESIRRRVTDILLHQRRKYTYLFS